MSKIINDLIQSYESAKPENIDGEKIKVNSVVSRAAYIYEKIRNAVDYNEEHLVRKNAIFRIMKRKLVFEKAILENYLFDKFHSDNIAEQLLQELIRGKYLPNGISVQMIPEVDNIIQKYNSLIARIKELEGKIDKKLYNLILEIEAVEIENRLAPDKKEKALARAMFTSMSPRIKLPTTFDNEKEKELQLYVACHKILFKWDEAMLTYLLFTLYYPDWKNGGEEAVLTVANNIRSLQAEIAKQLSHPWAKRMLLILQKKAVVFWIIQDILNDKLKDAQTIFKDTERLTLEVKEACQKRYKGIGIKLRRGVVRSIIYVFFTKMILAIALEFPMDWYLAGEINYLTAFINIIFPPILMFIVAMMIRLPKNENTKKILEEIKMINAGVGDSKIYPLKDPKKRGRILNFFFDLIFTLSFVFSLSVLFWVLNKLNFNVFSSLIFVLFLTLVSFFGIRIRRPVNDILAIDRKDSFLGAIVDLIALPFVSMGRWMSVGFSKLNFFAYFLDFIIEAPFKLLIEIFEDFFKFYREKKEDMLQE